MLITGYENYSISTDGIVTNNSTGRRLKPDIIWDGYERVTLCSQGRTERFRVHRIVASHYIPNPHNLPIINHKDGNRRNNRVDNLEWSTSKNNRNHGHVPRGEEVTWSKLTAEDVHRVCKLIQEGLTRGRILKQLPNVTKCQFDDIRRKRSWKHISSNYNWT